MPQTFFPGKSRGLSLAVGAASFLTPALGAQEFLFNESIAGTYAWSTGTGWDTAPTSGPQTALGLYTGAQLAALPVGGSSVTLTNDMGAFTLNRLTLGGDIAMHTDAGTRALTLNLGGGQLNFVNDGANAPVIDLGAINRSANTPSRQANIIYNVANDLAFAGAALFTGNGTSTFNFSGAVTADDLSKSGTSALTLSGPLTLDGDLVAEGGTLTVSGPLTLGGELVARGGTMTIAGALAFTGAFDGEIAVRDGTIILRDSALTTGSVSAVRLGGAESANSSVFGAAAAGGVTKDLAVTIERGRGSISTTRTNSSGTFTLNIGTINREAGATFSTTLGSNTVIKTDQSQLVNGILGGWAFSSTLDNWLTVDANGNLVQYSGYTDVNLTGATPTIASNASANVRLTNPAVGDTYQVALGGSGVTDVNTILQAVAPAGGATSATLFPTVNINIGAGNTLRLGRFGGVMIQASAGERWRNPYGRMIFNGGSLTAGGAADTAGEIVFSATGLVGTSSGDSTSRNFVGIQVGSNIVDNGAGAVSVIIDSDRTVQFSGTGNAYSGNTYVNRGRLIVDHSNGLGSGDVYVHAGMTNGGQAYLASSGGYANDFFIAGAGYHGGTLSALALANGADVSGDISLLADAAVRIATAHESTLSGRFLTNGHVATFGNNSVIGTLILDLADGSDLSGGVIVSHSGATAGGFTLRLAEAGLYFGNLHFDNTRGNSGGGTPSTAALELNGNNLTVNALTSYLASARAAAEIRNSSTAAAAATLTVGQGNAESAVYAGSIADGHASAVLNLAKTGTGTQELSGANSYTGTTTVNGGTLLVSGTLTGTSGVTVNNGGTFAYTNALALNRAVTVANGGTFRSSGGDVTGSVSFANGARLTGTNWNVGTLWLTVANGVIVNPGDGGVGSASGSEVLLGAGGVYEWEVNAVTGVAGTNWDVFHASLLLEFESTLTSESRFVVKLISLDALGDAGLLAGFDGTQNYSWTIATGADVQDGTASGVVSSMFTVDTSSFQNAYAGSFSVNLVGNALMLDYAGAAIPEPSAWATIVGGLALAFVGLRRRRG